MKKNLFLKLGLPILGVCLIITGIFFSTKVEASKYSLITKDQIVDSNYIAKSSTIDIDGTVNGDVLAMGENVNVSGDINGNLVIFSTRAKISGNISGSIIFFGGDIHVKTKNEINSLLSVSETATIESSIKNNTYIASENLRLDGGIIGQDLYVASKIININSKVDRDFSVLSENITFEEFGKIGRDLKYNTDANTNLNPEDVLGKIIKYTPQTKNKGFQGFIKRVNIINLSITFITLLILGLLFARHTKELSKKVSEKYVKDFANNLLVGTLILFLFPPLFIFLSLTLFGIKIALFLLLAFILLFLSSCIITAISIGFYINKVLFENNNIFTGVLIGATLFTLLELIPIVGPVVKFIFIVAGVGCIVKYKKEILNKLNESSESKEEKTKIKKLKIQNKPKPKKIKKAEIKKQPSKKRGRPRKNEK